MQQRRELFASYRRYRSVGVSCIAQDIERENVHQGNAIGAKAEFGLSDGILEELWRRPRKHFFSIGKSGLKPSHLRSLRELVQAHTLVKVKVNIPGADFDQVSLQLCGRISIPGFETRKEFDVPEAPSVSMVMYRTAQNMILFAETQFLTDQAAAETSGD